LDFEIQRFTRHCAATGREIKPGESFYSALVSKGAQVERQDFAAESWTGPPEGALGWWRSQVPVPSAQKMQLAPNDVMLELLEQWEADPTRHDSRYVLSLLLVRRRVLRLEDTETDESGNEISELYCPKRDCTYRVSAVMPSDERVAEIQDELSKLLFAGAEGGDERQKAEAGKRKPESGAED
jgi:hypothetical protein